MTRVCVVGPGGRMGQAVLALARADERFTLTGALVRAGSDSIGREVAPGVAATAEIAAALADAEVYIDFSLPEATAAIAQVARERGVAGVVGTTGLGEDAQAALDALAERAAVVWAPNFSPGVNLLLDLASRAARALGDEFDLEIVELHHRNKRDSPSGTALALADALRHGRAEADSPGAGELSLHVGRAGDVGARPISELGIAAVRGGDVIGEHTAYLFGEHERIELTHRASSRAVFASGALRAGAWAATRAPGRYGMRDVLAL
ncbi:dihydrodipicolinate reductase [Haliangium ochraceum DSM 14365]|uniref:4-hydroxy-tetrahydrodipicolinate reductase n=1 Tax=Haliangium ochraceum (strain DSM 14365 / JCM 11303 / SMP-2) TaxID=502025 RepID=D0LJC9_HALO1|nr:dihydrodipicolinate reductase [Haliangium ochraceum DSM 14365]